MKRKITNEFYLGTVSNGLLILPNFLIARCSTGQDFHSPFIITSLLEQNNSPRKPLYSICKLAILSGSLSSTVLVNSSSSRNHPPPWRSGRIKIPARVTGSGPPAGGSMPACWAGGPTTVPSSASVGCTPPMNKKTPSGPSCHSEVRRGPRSKSKASVLLFEQKNPNSVPGPTGDPVDCEVGQALADGNAVVARLNHAFRNGHGVRFADVDAVRVRAISGRSYFYSVDRYAAALGYVHVESHAVDQVYPFDSRIIHIVHLHLRPEF
ncbi:3-isopropylmalate dehydratase large subunit [Striga asiatica]|uniref:3-isopropylmalate dehydratase large subunit n=1 Tax=Striga asiatica TaxID=4170 RepID=A0A5A7P4Z0_STRAF|nr:3-isopropylmalate dehydratase large subunit [Striga asiatica]